MCFAKFHVWSKWQIIEPRTKLSKLRFTFHDLHLMLRQIQPIDLQSMRTIGKIISTYKKTKMTRCRLVSPVEKCKHQNQIKESICQSEVLVIKWVLLFVLMQRGFVTRAEAWSRSSETAGNISDKEMIYVQDIFHIWNAAKSKRKICLFDLSSSVPFSVISDDNRKFQWTLVISAVCCFHSSHACHTVGPVTTLNHP